MADTVFRIKAVMDVNDVVSNVGTIQKSLSKLKLPDNLKDNLSKNIGAFYKEYDKYQKKLADGIKTQGDYNQIEKSLNRLRVLYTDIGKDAAKAIKIDPNALFDLNEGKFKGIVDKIEQTIKQLSNIKVDTKAFTGPIEEIGKLTKNQKIVGDEGILTRMMGHIETGNISQAKKEYESLIQEIQKAAPKFDELGNRINKPGTFNTTHFDQMQAALAKMGTALVEAGQNTKPLEEELNRLQQELAETVSAASKDLIGNVDDYNKQAAGVEKVTDSLKRMHEEEYNFNRQAQDIDRQIQSYFGLSQMIRKVGEIARDAFQTVKELDAAMVETAVVTNFDVGDMWNMLPTYTANANQLGATIKDVYEAATLYFQQGLNLSQSMGLANETLKMARIGGLQAAEATNMMTAALRGFNMEINQMSAKRINDVYSELAAITAADTKEIGSAMERTASIANSANMEFETTSAFLAQMIETTREAPENLGTAMKTIIARFQEMKQDPTKLVDSEGVALDANKIDTALKTIGVELKNQKGEFRDLDDVFLDISERWDSLTQGQQRYIATIAAGSRQQSRFIAMMQNYERVKELVDAANNSAGAGQKQFEKTLEGLSAKLNKLKNAWDQFTMGLMNNQLIKTGIDALTGFFTIVNKIFNVFTKPFPDPFEGLIKSALTLTSTLALLNFGKKGARGLIMGGVGWWKNEGKFTDNFKSGWGVKEASTSGAESGRAWTKSFVGAVGQNSSIKNAIKEATKVSKVEGTKAVSFKQAYGSLTGNQAFQMINSQTMGPEFEAALKNAIMQACQNVDSTKIGAQEAEEFANGFVNRIKQGKIKGTLKQAIQQAESEQNLRPGSINEGLVDKPVGNLNKELKNFNNTITRAGDGLMTFGMILQQTPLAPFGTALSMAGSVLMSFGSSLSLVRDIYLENIAVAKADAIAKAGDAVATEILGDVQLSTAAKAKVLGAALWTSLGPLALIAAAIGVAIIAYKAFDAIHVSKKEELEATTDAAAAASEAFDLAKQETSELNDAISRIQESDNAFDNLVAGTAEFNEQLVTANQQITELAQKYPMLNDYITTDKNGLMHISDEGLKAVKEYQKQIQARASAINIIQAADLAALENQQKAEKLRSKWGKDETEQKKDQENADLLDQQAEAEKQAARLNAIRTSLQAKELTNIEAISAAYAGLYEEKRKAAEIEVNSMDKHERREAYAEYHGYKYNKSTGKIKDSEGNEVDYDDSVLKDEVIENTVLLDFEANAGTLDTVLSGLDDKFNEVLGKNFENSSHVISDLLSSNIETNTDIIDEILSGQSSELQKIVNNLSEEEVAAILGITTEEAGKQLDVYQKQVGDLLTEKAQNIAEAQYESYSQLAAMMAQAEYETPLNAKSSTAQNEIRQELKWLSAQEAATLSTIGQTLQQNVGPEAMTRFISQASDIYLSENEGLIDEFNGILDGINWESPASRLEGYNKAIQSSRQEISAWGKSMLSAADEANIVGDAFDEFVSGDWDNLKENADEFKNAMGEIDGAGILKASEQSKSLKALLDSGAVSATGVAMALQGIEDGKYSISAVDGVVLQLLSSLNRLADVATEAHNIIENFDAGIDTGEGEEFVSENAEKVQEYMSNNEWGNQQLQNYIKLAAGTERWNEALRDNHGDLEATAKSLSKYSTTFKDGFMGAWKQLINDKGINGESLTENLKSADIKEGLRKKFEAVDFTIGEDNRLNVELGELTTDEFQTYLQEVYGVSEEYAQLMMQNLSNYDAQLSAQLKKNDLQAVVQSKSFKENRGSIVNDRGKEVPILTDAELKAFQEAGGSLRELADAAGVTVQDLKNAQLKVLDENGNARTDYKDLVRDYDAKLGSGQGTIKDLLNVDELQDKLNRLDINKLMSDFRASSFTEDQTMQSAWRAYQKAQEEGKGVSFEGQALDNNIKTFEEFQSAISELTETSKWVPIGEAIAQGFMNAYNQNSSTGTTDSNTIPGTNIQIGTDTAAANSEIDGVANHWGQVENKINNSPAVLKAENKDATQKTTEVMTSWGQVVDSGATKPLVVDADTTKADRGIETVKSHYGELKDETGKPLTIGSVQKTEDKSNKGSQKKSSTYTVDVKGQDKVEELQQKLKKLNDLVKQGGTYTLDVSGVSQIKAAAKAAKTLSNNTGTKTIGVKTGKADTSSVQAAKSTISKTSAKIQVGANTSPALAAAETARKAIDRKKATIDVSINQTGNKTVHINIKKSGSSVGGFNEGLAKGKNNHISYQSMPTFGSLAKGYRYGTVGPKNKGGLTLTGEKGFEIAWLPSENRSMVLGTQGPQMLELPSDAVVYTHEQSKKIIKQKAIPAGSHSNTGIIIGGDDDTGGGGTGSGNKPGKHNPKAKAVWIKLDTPGKVSVWWDNQVRKVEAVQRAIDKLLKKVEKGIKEIGMTLRQFGEQNYVKEYLAQIQEAIKLNNQSLDKANAELENLDFDKNKSKKSISYTQKYRKKGSKKTKKKTKKATVSLSDYILYDEEHDTYIIDQDAIDKVAKKNKSKAKAIKDAANEKINDKLSKRNTAEDNIEKAQEALDKFAEDLYEAFFAWKNELTKIWNITQKIEASEGRISRAKAFQELLNKQIETGIVETADDAFNAQTMEAFVLGVQESVGKINEQVELLEEQKNVVDRALSSKDEAATLASIQNKLNPRYALDQQAESYKQQEKELKENIEEENKKITEAKSKRKALKKKLKKAKTKAEKKKIQAQIDEQDEIIKTANEQIANYQSQIETAVAEYTRILAEAQDYLNDTEKLAYEKDAEHLQDQLKVQALAQKYMTVTRNADGTIDIDFNSELFESDKENALLNSTTAEAIQEYVKQIVEESKTLNDNYENVTSAISDLYGDLATLQEQWVGYAEELWDISEAETKQEIDNFKKLSESITNALKKLLDEVKRKLDERRQQEDNANTEREIAQKQQRLAALRADTAGGHQVEIAQLEREIAEAQQNYQRTLEDQLLEQLQHQADLAAEQRERLIELEEAILEGTNNAALVDMWMADPENFRDEIEAAYKTANDYDKKPLAMQEDLDRKFESMMNGLVNNQSQQEVLKNVIASLDSTLQMLKDSLDNMNNKTQISSIQDLRDLGFTDKQIHEQAGRGLDEFIAAGTTDVTDLKNAGFTAKELVENNPEDYTIDKLKSAEYTAEELKEAGFTALQLKEAGFENYDEVKDLYTVQELADAGYQEAINKVNYDAKIQEIANSKKVTAQNLAEAKELGKAINIGFATVLQDLAQTENLDWKQVIKAFKAGNYSKLRLALTFGSSKFKKAFDEVYGKGEYNSAKKKANKKKKTPYQFEQGGLADFTGPAWLDGTTSRPELVLNAQDTKNFLALRDVLSKAINSTGATNNSYDNANYEININVDHIANDYDVDRMAERIKKDIIKSAGYRNVNQVRNFK